MKTLRKERYFLQNYVSVRSLGISEMKRREKNQFFCEKSKPTVFDFQAVSIIFLVKKST